MDNVHAEEGREENSHQLKIHQKDKISSQVAAGRICNNIHRVCYQRSDTDMLRRRIIAQWFESMLLSHILDPGTIFLLSPSLLS